MQLSKCEKYCIPFKLLIHTEKYINGWWPFSKVIWALSCKFSQKKKMATTLSPKHHLSHKQQTNCLRNVTLLSHFLTNSHISHRRDPPFSPRSPTACQVNRKQNILCMVQNLHPCTDWAATFKQKELPGLNYAPLFPGKTSTLELFPLFSSYFFMKTVAN